MRRRRGAPGREGRNARWRGEGPAGRRRQAEAPSRPGAPTPPLWPWRRFIGIPSCSSASRVQQHIWTSWGRSVHSRKFHVRSVRSLLPMHATTTQAQAGSCAFGSGRRSLLAARPSRELFAAFARRWWGEIAGTGQNRNKHTGGAAVILCWAPRRARRFVTTG